MLLTGTSADHFKRLSAHFRAGEFACRHCGVYRIDTRLVDSLERLRGVIGPVAVTSGYRCAVHNARVGGAQSSRHLISDAADIVTVDHVPVLDVVRHAVRLFDGVGVYLTSAGSAFLHVDMFTGRKNPYWVQDHRRAEPKVYLPTVGELEAVVRTWGKVST